MNLLQRFATREPTLCAVCRRHATGLGYAPRQGAKAVWLCDDYTCHQLGKRIYHMPKSTLDAYEHGASIDAMDAAGSYLAEIEKFDMRELSDQELAEFRTRFVVGYEDAMRKKILSGEAPF